MKLKQAFQPMVASVLLLVLTAQQTQAGLLYTVKESSDRLVTVDTDTLAVTDIGPLNLTFNFGGLAYDPLGDILYGVDGRSSKSLFTVDRNTGTASVVGVHGVTDLFGLAYDSKNRVLFGTQFSQGSGFHTLDVSTGVATFIGNMAHTIGGLAYDSLNDRLVGIQDGAGDLYEINRTNGSQTLLYDGSFVNDSGLAYDPDKNLFWDIDWNGCLYSYDPSDEFARTTHLTGLGSYDGLAYVSTSIPEPTTLAIWGTLSGLGLIAARRRRKQLA